MFKYLTEFFASLKIKVVPGLFFARSFASQTLTSTTYPKTGSISPTLISSFETSLKIVSIKSLILLLLLSYDKPRVRFPVFPPTVFFPRSMDLLIGVDGEVEDCVDGEVDDEIVLEVEL